MQSSNLAVRMLLHSNTTFDRPRLDGRFAGGAGAAKPRKKTKETLCEDSCHDAVHSPNSRKKNGGSVMPEYSYSQVPLIDNWCQSAHADDPDEEAFYGEHDLHSRSSDSDECLEHSYKRYNGFGKSSGK